MMELPQDAEDQIREEIERVKRLKEEENGWTQKKFVLMGRIEGLRWALGEEVEE